MAAAQRHAELVGHGHHVVRVDVVQEEADQPGATRVRAENADAA
jgi:hypothetical protein